jgi:MFS family permease
MVAGGPFASILFTILWGLVCVQYGSSGWNWNGTLFWTSLFIGLCSLIPFSSGLSKSDAARLWQLIRISRASPVLDGDPGASNGRSEGAASA